MRLPILLISNRGLAACGLMAAVAALGLAYGLQYGAGLDPCPLCIFQRMAAAGFGLVCLVALVHGPNQRAARVYAGMAGMVALAGGAIALRQVYIMHLPPSTAPACAPSLSTLIHMMPLHNVVVLVLRGDASCAGVKGSFLGLKLPAWSAIYFAGLAVPSIVILLRGQSATDNRNLS